MFPRYLKPVSRYFRSQRNRRLCSIIDELSKEKSDPVEILDIGGSLIFWLSIPDVCRAKCHIRLINLPGAYEEAILSTEEESIRNLFDHLTGDARDLSRFADKTFDLVVCNSVIEHVGSWDDMTKAANEAKRVGKRGWIQVPAFEFPVEQHFLLPFLHWFADPVQIKMLKVLHHSFKKSSVYEQHMSVYHVRPLTRTQLRHLFPETALCSEWLLFPKSHIATW